MSETFSRQEHTVINVGEEEGEGLRLITCVKASQGFDWNMGMLFPPNLDSWFRGFGVRGWMTWNWANDDVCAKEMFLPSYVDYHFDDLERRQDPVKDIIVTDEEVRNMFPS